MFIFVKDSTLLHIGVGNSSFLLFLKFIIMEVKIKAIHFDIADKLVDFVNKKFEKIERRNEAVASAEVNLTLVKPETAKNKEAAVKLIIPGSQDLFASKTADTFEEAIDLALDALKPQLEKIKDKK